MSRVSRRKLLARGTALIAAGSASEIGIDLSATASEDPVKLEADLWFAADDYRSALVAEWQRLETALFEKARAMQISCEAACEGDLSEAKAMRAQAAQIAKMDHLLRERAGEISSTKATAMVGAIAKIELSLRVQGPWDWRDHALELAEGGLADLRELTKRA